MIKNDVYFYSWVGLGWSMQILFFENEAGLLTVDSDLLACIHWTRESPYDDKRAETALNYLKKEKSPMRDARSLEGRPNFRGMIRSSDDRNYSFHRKILITYFYRLTI